MSRMFFSAIMSYFVGFMKMAASSVYRDTLIPLPRGEMGCNTPLSIAMCSSLYRGSIARIKSMGEMGSSCLMPLSCLRGFPGVPW
jgi:hypothetical protein